MHTVLICSSPTPKDKQRFSSLPTFRVVKLEKEKPPLFLFSTFFFLPFTKYFSCPPLIDKFIIIMNGFSHFPVLFKA